MKLVKNENGVQYYVFESFEKTGLVNHCFSTRKGGVSTGCYESLNLSFREDKRENVIENYRLICSAMGSDYNNVVFSNQVHEDKLYEVKEEDRGKGLLRESDIKGIDGLYTDKKNIILTTFYADCVPLFFLDTNKKVIALSHSGWKGTVKEIGRRTVEIFKEKYNSNLNDIIAGIGPSIGGCCFEVDKPVADIFEKELPFSKEFIKKEENEKYKIDLQEINKQILINSGLKEENIELSGLCTKCNPDTFYSHRVMGAERGSLAGLMELK